MRAPSLWLGCFFFFLFSPRRTKRIYIHIYKMEARKVYYNPFHVSTNKKQPLSSILSRCVCVLPYPPHFWLFFLLKNFWLFLFFLPSSLCLSFNVKTVNQLPGERSWVQRAIIGARE
jgi:hypothetical protein